MERPPRQTHRTRLARQSEPGRRWGETETRRNEDNLAQSRVPGAETLPRRQTAVTAQMPNTPDRRRPRDKSTLTASKTVRPTQAIATRNASKTHRQPFHVFRAEKRGSVILTELNRRDAEATVRQRNGQIQVPAIASTADRGAQPHDLCCAVQTLSWDKQSTLKAVPHAYIITTTEKRVKTQKIL